MYSQKIFSIDMNSNILVFKRINTNTFAFRLVNTNFCELKYNTYLYFIYYCIYYVRIHNSKFEHSLKHEYNLYLYVYLHFASISVFT